MTGAATAALVAAGVVAVVDWVAVARSLKRLEYFAKPSALIGLIAVALLIDPSDETRRAWFTVALVFSLAGDVFLMLPRDLFVAGLGSFLLGHLAYVGGFLVVRPEGADLLIAVAVTIVIGGILAPRVLRGVRANADPALLAPVALYMLVISAMLALALASGIAVAAAGATLFYSSDALIAWERFILPRPWARTAIIVTYHLGQGLLVTSLLV